MALTDFFLSPDGDGSKDGSDIDNPFQAITSGDWTSSLDSQTLQDRRWIWLEGTYNCTTQLVTSGTVPTAAAPMQWVGADSSGNILRPKFDETGMSLDLTNYPKLVCSENVEMIFTHEHTAYKCMSLENTNASFSKSGVIENSTGDLDVQNWTGCFFKTASDNNNAEVLTMSNSNLSMCEVVLTSGGFNSVVRMLSGGVMNNCRIKGPGILSGGGNSCGVRINSGNVTIIDTLIYNIPGDAIFHESTNDRQTIAVSGCSIIDVAGAGIDISNLDGTNISSRGSAMEHCVIFNCGKGIEAAAEDGRQPGAQFLAMGENTANFSNMDSYEDMIDVVAITSADFVDYANDDFRIRRDSAIYKILGDKNMGALQNEDYEFASVS